MIVIVEKVQGKADEVHFLSISAFAFLTDLFHYFKTISENIVILSSYTVYCSRVDAKTFGWSFTVLLSHLSFVQCEQVKFRHKKKLKIKVSHSVVAVGGSGQRPSSIT